MNCPNLEPLTRLDAVPVIRIKNLQKSRDYWQDRGTGSAQCTLLNNIRSKRSSKPKGERQRTRSEPSCRSKCAQPSASKPFKDPVLLTTLTNRLVRNHAVLKYSLTSRSRCASVRFNYFSRISGSYPFYGIWTLFYFVAS
jgi:hypothetical protein